MPPLCGLPNKEAQDLVVDGVDRWRSRYNHAFTRPSPRQLVELKAILDQSRNFLEGKIVAELSSILAIQENP